MSAVAAVRNPAFCNAEGPAHHLLLVLASHVNEADDLANPSVGTLAFEVRMSERTVQRLSRRLEASGELIVRTRGVGVKHTTIYALRALELWRLARGRKGDRVLSPLAAQSQARKGDNLGPRKVTTKVQKGDRALSLKRFKEREKARARATGLAALNAPPAASPRVNGDDPLPMSEQRKRAKAAIAMLARMTS